MRTSSTSEDPPMGFGFNERVSPSVVAAAGAALHHPSHHSPCPPLAHVAPSIATGLVKAGSKVGKPSLDRFVRSSYPQEFKDGRTGAPGGARDPLDLPQLLGSSTGQGPSHAVGTDATIETFLEILRPV
eukprot:4313299-Amphidinium_carterae.3